MASQTNTKTAINHLLWGIRKRFTKDFLIIFQFCLQNYKKRRNFTPEKITFLNEQQI